MLDDNFNRSFKGLVISSQSSFTKALCQISQQRFLTIAEKNATDAFFSGRYNDPAKPGFSEPILYLHIFRPALVLCCAHARPRFLIRIVC